MPCYICDWSPKNDSLYHNGLSLLSQGPKRLLIDSQGRTICSHCEAEGQSEEISIEEHEELEEIE